MMRGSQETTKVTLIGAPLDGKYQAVRELGAGGMGTVYEAYHLGIDRRVAVKVLHPDILKLPGVVKRFEREARITGTLGHPNIVTVTDIGTTPEGAPYLVMEYLEGRSLAQAIHQTSFTVDQAVQIMIPVLDALSVVHAKGIIHRDLKPENIFLADQIGAGGRTTTVVKLLDFGISKPLVFGENSTTVTQAGKVLGTPYYMSPEQSRGLELDPRADIWACGVILYEILTRQRPFKADTHPDLFIKIILEDPDPPCQIRPDIPPALEQVVLRALAKKKEERFASADELLSELEAFRREVSLPHLHRIAEEDRSVGADPPYSSSLDQDASPTAPFDAVDSVLLSSSGAVTTPQLRDPVSLLGSGGGSSSPEVPSAAPVARRSMSLADGRWWVLVAVLIGLGAAIGTVVALMVTMNASSEAPPGEPMNPEPMAMTGEVGERGAEATERGAEAMELLPEDGVATAVALPAGIGPDGDLSEPSHTVKAPAFVWETEPVLEDGGAPEPPPIARPSAKRAPREGDRPLTRDEVYQGMRTLTPRIRECLHRSGDPPPRVDLTIQVDGMGFATYRDARPQPPLQVAACLRDVVSTGTFRATGGESIAVVFPMTGEARESTPRNLPSVGGKRPSLAAENPYEP